MCTCYPPLAVPACRLDMLAQCGPWLVRCGRAVHIRRRTPGSVCVCPTSGRRRSTSLHLNVLNASSKPVLIFLSLLHRTQTVFSFSPLSLSLLICRSFRTLGQTAISSRVRALYKQARRSIDQQASILESRNNFSNTQSWPIAGAHRKSPLRTLYNRTSYAGCSKSNFTFALVSPCRFSPNALAATVSAGTHLRPQSGSPTPLFLTSFFSKSNGNTIPKGNRSRMSSRLNEKQQNSLSISSLDRSNSFKCVYSSSSKYSCFLHHF